MVTILSFIFVLGILIFIHELGHFLVAKKVGIRVERFSLGFPPNIFTKKKGETTYCIGIIPLGGYVKMAGEQPDEESTGAPDEFMSKTVAQRAAVIFAGPFMNYVLAMVLMISIFYFGGRPVYDENRVIVGQVSEDGPAFEAGLKEGDMIIAIDGKQVSHFDTLRTIINSRIHEPLVLTWIHEQDTIVAEMITMAAPMQNDQGEIDSIGVIGFTQKPVRYESNSFGEALSGGFVTTHVIVVETVKFVTKFVTGQVSPKMIGGPLFIARQSGKEARKGAASLFFFMAVLSVNLGVLNVLPIPVLDGGHLVFLAVEKIRGSPLSMKTRMVAQQIGLVVLLSLIVFVTYNDILRVIREF